MAGQLLTTVVSKGLSQGGTAAAGKKKKKQKKKGSVSPPEVDNSQTGASAATQDRLTLFGEAFLESIEGGVRPQKAPRIPKTDSAAAAKESPSLVDELFPKRRPTTQATASKRESKSAPISKAGAKKDSGPPDAEQEDEDKEERTRRVARPGDRRRFMSDKVADIRAKPQIAQPARKRGRRSEDDEIEQSGEFKKLLQDVWTYVTPHMEKGAAKQFQQAKIRAYGGTADKLTKMPYRILKERQKQDVVKQMEKVEADKILGVVTSVDKHRNKRGVHQALSHKKRDIKDKYTRQAGKRQLSLGMGARESRGMAVIPKHALAKLGKR